MYGLVVCFLRNDSHDLAIKAEAERVVAPCWYGSGDPGEEAIVVSSAAAEACAICAECQCGNYDQKR